MVVWMNTSILSFMDVLYAEKLISQIESRKSES